MNEIIWSIWDCLSVQIEKSFSYRDHFLIQFETLNIESYCEI